MSEGISKIIPVIEEELSVEKRSVDVGGVRVTKHIHTHEEVIDELLRQERVTVERRPINQRVDRAPTVRREGNTVIIPILEEVLAVEKRLVLKEELHLTMQQTEVRQPQTVGLRREEATVKRLHSLKRKEQ